MFRTSSSFVDECSAARVLTVLRHKGLALSLQQLDYELSTYSIGPLLTELNLRLRGFSSPRILIDCIWLSNPYGGITRVWDQIFNTFSLSGLVSESYPIAFINCPNRDFNHASLIKLDSSFVDPLDFSHLAQVSTDNIRFVSDWGAEVFCSTWITRAGLSPSCPEVALVHDCIPEHSSAVDPLLLSLRQNWISSATSHLTVSSNTSNDLIRLFNLNPSQVDWCHLSPMTSSDIPNKAQYSHFLSIISRIGITAPFVFLPGSGCVGSYKNPEVVASAITDLKLSEFSLLISGVNAPLIRDNILANFPLLSSRIYCAGFSDEELVLFYKFAIVVVPSRYEGFGLPVIEVMASGGHPLVADSPGLRESGGEAALRFHPDSSSELTSLILLLAHSPSRTLFTKYLNMRVKSRLSRLNVDLLGLSLLAKCRSSII